MSNAGPQQTVQPKSRLPLIAFVLIVVGILLFWVLPYEMGPRQVKVEYETARTPR